MIIDRIMFNIKPGCMEEAVTVVKAEASRMGMDFRILTSEMGTFDTFVFEAKFENLAADEAFWGAWFGTPEQQAFSQQFDPLHLPGGESSAWDIREPRSAPLTGKLVNRRTVVVKIGRMDDLIALLNENRGETMRYEILTARFGPNDTIQIDFEFDSFDQYEKEWGDWSQSSEAGAFMEKWWQLTEPGGTNEIWIVV